MAEFILLMLKIESSLSADTIVGRSTGGNWLTSSQKHLSS